MSANRRNIMLGTAGHVDHGKTALVKMLTGCETDTLAEEKQRGLTIDLGFAPCRLADKRVVGVVDVPGHVDFIRNMVAGAHGIDVVIFVVAADDGIMPQTHEHLHILTLMGLRHGLVALTKIDLVEPDRREQVIQDLRGLLAGTFLAESPICPLSNVTGEGFDGFFDSLNSVVAACEDRACSGLFRVWVEDVFTIRGTGTVMTGIPTSGRVQVGDSLRLLPGDAVGHVRRMQVYGDIATEARAGECVALNLPEIDHETARRGMVLCESDALTPVSLVEGELQILNSIASKVADNLEVHLHIGTASVMARVAMLETNEMNAGQKQMIQLRLETPLALAPGDRFVIRGNLPGFDGLATIGGGRLLGVSDIRLRRRKPWTLATLVARREAIDDAGRWGELMLRESPSPLTTQELHRRCLRRPEEIALMVEHLQTQGRILRSESGAWVHREVLDETAARMLSAVQTFHAANPQRAGLERGELCKLVGGDAVVAGMTIDSLVASKRLENRGTVLAQPGWGAHVSDREQQLSDRLAAELQRAGWAPPSLEELAGSLRETPPRIEKLLRLLIERDIAVRLDPRVVMHRDSVEAGKQVALRLFGRAPSFSTMEFRDALGVSRKFAVPLLDHLDTVRFTVRSGHNRTPGAEAKKLLPPKAPS